MSDGASPDFTPEELVDLELRHQGIPDCSAMDFRPRPGVGVRRRDPGSSPPCYRNTGGDTAQAVLTLRRTDKGARSLCRSLFGPRGSHHAPSGQLQSRAGDWVSRRFPRILCSRPSQTDAVLVWCKRSRRSGSDIRRRLLLLMVDAGISAPVASSETGTPFKPSTGIGNLIVRTRPSEAC
jgi:hypothetical protein